MTDLIRVRFKRDAIVERAHADPTKGGYHRDIIPAGTVKDLKFSSLQFWQAKGDYVEVIPVEEKRQMPFAQVASDVSKASVRRALERLRSAYALDDMQSAIEAFDELLSDGAFELVPDLLSDTRMLLEAAKDDLRDGRGFIVNPQEFEEALEEFDQLLLPPSRRRKAG